MSLSARRFRDDRGAIMAEAALITPFLLVMIFGILEFGGLFRDYLTLGNASAGATREAAIVGDANNADGLILESLAKAASAMPRGQVETIVVWHASGPNDSVPATCAAGTPVAGTSADEVGSCNVYTNTGANPWWTWTSTTLTNCSAVGPPPSPQRFWCPTWRKTAVKATNGNGPPDYLGVYIKVRHPWITGLFGSSVVITNTSITHLETTALV
jgi:Flp pilus assembly protein TadG